MAAAVGRGLYFVGRHTLFNRYGAAAIAPAIGPDLQFDTSKKRSRGFSKLNSSKRLKLGDFVATDARGFTARQRKQFALRKFSMARNRSRRTPRRRIRRRRRRTSGRSIRQLRLRLHEPKTLSIIEDVNGELNPGDTVTPVVLMLNLSSNFTQGLQNDQFTGNEIFIKGFKAKYHLVNETADQTYTIQWIFFRSRHTAALMTGGGALYGNTTTSVVAPAQTPPNSNPPLFRATGNAAFVGNSPVTDFDAEQIRIKKVYTVQVNPGGSGAAGRKVSFWFPVNKIHKFRDPVEGDLGTAPNHGTWGDWYLAVRVFAPTASQLSATNAVFFDASINAYFRDV